MLSAMVVSMGVLQSLREPLTSHDERSVGCTGSWYPRETQPALPPPCPAQPQDSALALGTEVVGLVPE